MSYSKAFSFTGVNAIALPRPFLLSGCVTTPTTSWFSIRAANVGTAKSGVPINTTRILLPPHHDMAHSLSRRKAHRQDGLSHVVMLLHEVPLPR